VKLSGKIIGTNGLSIRRPFLPPIGGSPPFLRGKLRRATGLRRVFAELFFGIFTEFVVVR
jgi:hypothetical protein